MLIGREFADAELLDQLGVGRSLGVTVPEGCHLLSCEIRCSPLDAVDLEDALHSGTTESEPLADHCHVHPKPEVRDEASRLIWRSYIASLPRDAPIGLCEKLTLPICLVQPRVL